MKATMGVVGTKQNLRTKVWWPGMGKATERHCRACHGCQPVARPDPPEPIRSTSLPDGPWQDLAVGLMGPLPSGQSLLVTVDYYSRFYEVEIMQSTTTEKIIDVWLIPSADMGCQIPSSQTMVHNLSQMNLENIANSIVLYIRKLLPSGPKPKERLRDRTGHCWNDYKLLRQRTNHGEQN